MGAPLKEVRIYVPEWVHILLTARGKAFDEDLGAIAKRPVMEWAKREVHAHKVAEKLFRNTGMQPELFGDDSEEVGSDSANAGVTRSGRR